MKALLKYVNADDGSFWMTFEDFCNQFDQLYICKLHNDWHNIKLTGSWSISNNTAGGCSNNTNWFNNPQYLLSVNIDCSAIISITQSNIEKIKNNGNITIEGYLSNGIYIIENDNNNYKITKNIRNSKFIKTTSFIYRKVMTIEVELKSNMNYIILPCTFYKDQENTFILRVFCKDAEITCRKL